MADYRRRRKHQQNRERDMISVQNYSCSIISDQEASKIHGLGLESNSYSSDSDSGKSNFDEEFFKNKPGPIQISRSNIVTIKPISSPNRQLQGEALKISLYCKFCTPYFFPGHHPLQTTVTLIEHRYFFK